MRPGRLRFVRVSRLLTRLRPGREVRTHKSRPRKSAYSAKSAVKNPLRVFLRSLWFKPSGFLRDACRKSPAKKSAVPNSVSPLSALRSAPSALRILPRAERPKRGALAIASPCPVIDGVMQPSTPPSLPPSLPLPPPLRDWSVDIQQNGREGSLTYRDPAGSLTCSWEFGGGSTVAILAIGTETEWQTRHAWAVGRRAEIVQRIADDVVRQKVPGGRATIDLAGGWIFLSAAVPHQQPGANVSPFPPRRRRIISKSTIMLILSVIILGAALLAYGAKSLFSIKVAHGSPFEDSVRAGDSVVTMMHTLEAYVPSLHRDPGADRYRLSLFVQPMDPEKRGRLIPIARELPGNSFHLSRILGYDGTWVWLRAHDIVGVNLRTGKVIGTTQLERLNAALGERWDDGRRYTFVNRLRLISGDYQRVFEFDPETLRATTIAADRRNTSATLDPKLSEFLASGVRPTPTTWIGAHSVSEASGNYRVGSSLFAFNRADDAKQLRRLHNGELGPEQDRGTRQILSLTPVADTEYLNAAFIRSAANADPLRLAQPDGFLMIYTSVPGLKGTLKVARVDAAGKIAWDVDTTLDRFQLRQILPDAKTIVFVGTRLPIPDKVSEPLLVFVDTQTGKVSTVSLWQ